MLRLVLAGLCALILLLPIGTTLAGLRLLVVDGASMAPTYRVGDIVVIGGPTGSDLTIGAVVLIGDGEDRYVHRVVARDGDLATLQGDANEVADPAPVAQEDVAGVVLAHIGGTAAIVVNVTTSVAGRIALVLVLVLLLLLAPGRTNRTPRENAVAEDAEGAADESDVLLTAPTEVRA